MKTKHKYRSISAWKYFILFACMLVSAGMVHAQKENRKNSALEAIAKPTSKNGWIEFKREVTINPLTVFLEHKAAFGLEQNDEMKLRKSSTDDIGFTHYRYQQYYKGVRIEGADYIVHTNSEGHTYSANGKIITGLDIPTEPALNRNQVLGMAKEYSGQSQQQKSGEQQKNGQAARQLLVDSVTEATMELVICKSRNSDPWDPSMFRLAYRFDTRKNTSGRLRRVYIDASTSEIIKELPLESNCASASINTIFNDARTIYTKDISLFGTNYILKDNCQSASIHVRDFNSSTSNPNPDEITSGNNTWSSSTNQLFGSSVLWTVKKAYNYFLNVHGRQSYDDSNGNTDVLINAVFEDDNGNYYTDNAAMSFTGGNMYVGLGSTGTLTNSYSTLDILCHEYAHAVTGSSAELEYQDQSGALNESFSDIFGEMGESYTTGDCDYLIGDQRDSGYTRSMAEPWLKNDPSTFLTDPDWYTGTNDEGGVHTNSGVQNYWFYLLANGGNITNANGEQIVVEGIGKSKARNIAYRNLVHYLSSQSQYPDAREGAIKAAEDLYGSCSNEVIQVGKAWYAVGVGPSLDAYSTEVCGNINYGIFKGINEVVSGGSGCNTTINPSISSVVFAGGYFVEIKTGFTASFNGNNTFTAMTDDCSFTYHLRGVQEVADAAQETQIMETVKVRMEKEKGTREPAVFPNPFNSQINLTFTPERTGKLMLVVTDIQGKTVLTATEEVKDEGVEKQMTLQLDHLHPGIYMLRVSDEQSSFVKKIVRSE